EVDVNILGHIFEHSLNEIEEINAELKGEEVDTSKTRRKKDGVFYTPKYITKYIVEHTVGKLCEEKKAELDIVDERFIESKRRTQKGISDLKNYREWLLGLTICDPACGSGAFLNQALEFLIAEHNYIDELQAKYHGESLVLSDIENQILENNLFGVDINEESVEIAKLSLWLRTAQKGRKLTSLNHNIKCGNSLIDDPEVAGDQAFEWEAEFSSVFENGGFDVVIGNPPYVNISMLPDDYLEFFGTEYSEIHTGYNDLMYYFLYKGIKLVKPQGSLGMITSNYFIGNEYAKKLRNFLSPNISSIINFVDYQVFEDANVHTTLIFANKFIKSDDVRYFELSSSNKTVTDLKNDNFNEVVVNRSELKDYWIFTEKKKSKLLKKVESKSILLGSITDIEKGSTTGRNSVFTIYSEIALRYNIEKDLLRKNVKNGDIDRYHIYDRGDYLIYTDGDTEIDEYPNALNYLEEHRNSLSKRNEVKKGKYPWWRLERPRKKEFYDTEEKILVPYRATNNRFAYDNERSFNDGGDVRFLVVSDSNYKIKYLLALLNSNLLNWYYGFIGKPKGNSREYFNEPLAKIPIAKTNSDIQNELAVFADKIIELKVSHEEIQKSFSELLLSKFEIEKLSRKLQSWHELTGKQFLKELKKKKVELSLDKEAEWLDYFTQQKSQADTLKTQIAQTDAEIDAMVYELYGLSEEEVRVVAGGM
ncbi:MAG: N-6 DNA methylase, partial [Gracilimonas sp.]